MRRPAAPRPRPRHRSRDIDLAGFDRNLVPHVNEWGVDRLVLRVKGSWASPSSGLSDLYYADVGSLAGSGWFTLPNNHADFRSVGTRKSAQCTLSIEAKWRPSRDRRSGTITISINANPTRTLHHLLARFGHEGDFLATVASLPIDEFFARADPSLIALGLDGGDNWLPNIALLRAALPGPVFAQFLPLYVERLQAFVTLVVEPDGYDGPISTGSTIVMDAPTATVSIRWGEVLVPQIESYFERYHSTAVPAVRVAAQRILAAHPIVRVRRYSNANVFEREGDRFSVLAELSTTRKLSVYAKSDRRMRFEVRRDGKGEYPPADAYAPPQARLLQIIEHEREAAATRIFWPTYGQMFDEPDRMYVADLIDLLTIICDACSDEGVSPRRVLTKLLSDDGYSQQTSTIPATLTNRLIRRGIIERVRLQRRSGRGSQVRYCLVEHYRDLPWALLPVIPEDVEPPTDGLWDA